MTSERQLAANRANAKRSTGPRTARGKQASRLNARIHGLATSVRGESGADAEIERLAAAIVEETRRADLRGLALGLAEAEIELRRVRKALTQWEAGPQSLPRLKRVLSPNAKIFRRVLAGANRRKRFVDMETLSEMTFERGWRPGLPEFIWVPTGKFRRDPAGAALERYERRALSRRKKAIRDFDHARSASAADG